MSMVTTKRLLASAAPLGVFFFLILMMYAGLVISRVPPIDPQNPATITIDRALAMFLNVASSDPVLAILQATNVATMVYGFIFYVVRAGKTATWIPLLTGIVFFLVYFVSFYIKFFEQSLQSTDPSTSTLLLLRKEYAIAVFINFYFGLIDAIQYTNVKKTDKNAARIFGFSSAYISVPVVVSLLIAFGLHSLLFSYGVGMIASVAFLAGVAAMVLFISNLIFSLANSPWYASNIQIVVR